MEPIPPNKSQRRRPWIKTPLIESATLSKAAGCRIFLKLDCLQPSGSFKSRGIGNFILSQLSDPSNDGKKLHFYNSSGGNAGLAAVVAARDLGCPCTIVVPHSTKQMMIDKLRVAGAADVIQHGASWYEADTYLRETFIKTSKQEGSSDVIREAGTVKNVYVPPFDHPLVWEGNSTIIPELVEQLPAREDVDEAQENAQFPAEVIICSVGGGGLFNGLIQGLHEYNKSHTSNSSKGKKVKVLATETKGADSLAYSLQNGTLKSLDAITSIATTLGALCVSSQTFQYASEPPEGVEVTSVVVSDAEAARGVVTFADEMRILVEPACGVSIDVATGKKLREAVGDGKLGPNSRVVVVVCGGSTVTPEIVAEYRSRLAQGWM
ncbi:L-serine dehydratase, putative [Talaromyces stipitatus ATCC 10500]|uniref:L-serine ammonia-lyase n=1 Tax=Talaromyces stipitatus (strain ATCC 10500 / CBS 375.48 / QM 6759 / NRRL 1006) TaxID=441959 RepID=B8M831_TALSN|nr:L-serine dehydratase, putative [Talaromyces stipitatus ATCC 10500]EED19993.1 L-serine dehydratase, putative [Talaromyces stipitatus ATCC 10500]